MVVNGQPLVEIAPIKNMLREKETHLGLSHGLSEVGYDIRISQTVSFKPSGNTVQRVSAKGKMEQTSWGKFMLASAMEEFAMPTDLYGVVHDKSTWARRGLSVFNTIIEPGWKGFLTLELVHHGSEDLVIHAGCGIAQVIFHKTLTKAAYRGKYQNQKDGVTSAILA